MSGVTDRRNHHAARTGRDAWPEGMTPQTGESPMRIHIDACAELETIVVHTRSSVYEVIVLRRDGDVLVRGGRQFTEFQRALFLGSTAGGGWVERRTIEIGFGMRFYLGDRFLITSPVQSLSRGPAGAAIGDCAAATEAGVPRDSRRSSTNTAS
jgi:hypothetical protein